MDTLHVATLNIRNLADRWDERLPLILADAAALQPDLFGLQEVVYPMQQDRVIGAAGAAHYDAIRGWAGRPEYGNSMLVRSDLARSDVERLDMGLNRAAHRCVVTMPGGRRRLRFTVVHLHHPPEAHAERLEQVERLIGWTVPVPGCDDIVVGDFNADPREPAYARMANAGFRSAYRETHDAEPAVTWPSGLQAPAMDTDGEPDCLDYIWCRGDAIVNAARVVFDRPAVDDPTIYPSDHFGLSATLAWS